MALEALQQMAVGYLVVLQWMSMRRRVNGMQSVTVVQPSEAHLQVGDPAIGEHA